MNALLLALPISAALAVEPAGWQRKSLENAPVSVLVPTGSQLQEAGQRHPGFDEATSGWQLQSKFWPARGESRMILFLQRGDITIYYSRDSADPKHRTLDDFVETEANGRKPEAEQYGKWKGYTVRLIALKDPNRHPGADAPFGDLAIHAVEFGPREYLAIVLHANPDAVPTYLPYFYKVRDSIQYRKTKPPVLVAAKKPEKPTPPSTAPDASSPNTDDRPPAPMPPRRVPLAFPLPRRSLILLPHLGAHGGLGRHGGVDSLRIGRNYYPYVRVLQCPQGFLPRPSEWPRAGAFVCEPIRPYSGQ